MIECAAGNIRPIQKVCEGSFGSLYTATYKPKNGGKSIKIALKNVVESADVKQEIELLSELSPFEGFASLLFVIESSSNCSKTRRVMIGTHDTRRPPLTPRHLAPRTQCVRLHQIQVPNPGGTFLLPNKEPARSGAQKIANSSASKYSALRH